VNTTAHSHGEIEQLAHRFWEKRGRPCGTPEADWFRAERVLSMEQDGILSKVARVIGSVVGHAAVMVANPREHEDHSSQSSSGPARS
jgi:Protein of unknown function (DUF2934)